MKVVFLGCTFEYSFGFGANITKVGYMAKGLTEAGATCVIHNGIVGSNKVNADSRTEYNGHIVTTYKQRGSVHISWIRNIYKLYKYLKSEHIKGEQNIAIVELDLYHIMLVYFILLKILGYKTIAISHEWGPITPGLNRLRILSHWLFAKSFGWFADGILPISEYIIDKIKHFKKPFFKLPIMADFEVKTKLYDKEEHNFVYCVGAGYFRSIQLIIDSYKEYNAQNGKIKLTLILSGNNESLKKVIDYIDSVNQRENIIIKTKLPYNDLLNEYANAAALLIPLDPRCIQDTARFSQKTAEYLSSHSPIITNDVGEIKYYFNNDEIIKCNFSEEGFCNAFKWLENNLEKAKEIGEKGYIKGKQEFDYRILSDKMYNFFTTIK